MMKLLTIIAFTLMTSIVFAQTEQELMDKASALRTEGQTKKAIKIYNEIIEMNPKFEMAYVSKGWSYIELNDYDKSFEAYGEGLKENPNSAQIYNARALLYKGIGNTDVALRDFKLSIKAAEMAEDDTLMYEIIVNQATAKSDLRDFQGAYDDLMRCYAFDSTDFAVLNNLAAVCDEINMGEKTLMYLFRVIAIDSTFVPGYVNIGFRYQTLGDFEKSITYFDKAIALQPDEPLSYNNRGYSKLKIGDLKGALEDVNTSLDLYPTNAYAFRNRALIYLEMGKKKKMCADLEKALGYGFTQLYGREVINLQRRECN